MPKHKKPVPVRGAFARAVRGAGYTDSKWKTTIPYTGTVKPDVNRTTPFRTIPKP